MPNVSYDTTTTRTLQPYRKWDRSPYDVNPASYNQSYFYLRNVKVVPAYVNRWTYFMTNGFLPFRSYKRVKDEVSVYTLGSLRTTVGAPYSAGIRDVRTDFRTSWYASEASVQYLVCTDPIYDTLRAKAIASANSKVREHNAGIFETLYELKKTEKMIVSTAKRLVSAVRHVRKGRFSRAASVLGMTTHPKNVSNKSSLQENWLAYRYGWTPLLGSIHESLASCYDFHKNRTFIRHASGRTCQVNYFLGNYATANNTTVNADKTLGWYTSVDQDNHPGLTWNIRRTWDRTYGVKASYVYRIDNPTLALTSHLGLANPLEVAWELVPFSFVADWFVNVGDVLESIGAFTGKTFLSGSLSFKWDSRLSISVSDLTAVAGYVPVGYTYSNFVSPQVQRRTIYMEREVLYSVPTFGFHYDCGLNLKRSIDAISLLSQAFK